jgi:hypothetical protein
MRHTALIVLSSLALVLATLAGAFLGVWRSGVATKSYGSPTELQQALNDAGLGCDAIGPMIGIPRTHKEPRSGICDVNGEQVTLLVGATPHGTSLVRQMPDPKHWGNVTWVRGPNWIVATSHRDAAIAVQHALGGELHGVDV